MIIQVNFGIEYKHYGVLFTWKNNGINLNQKIIHPITLSAILEKKWNEVYTVTRNCSFQFLRFQNCFLFNDFSNVALPSN